LVWCLAELGNFSEGIPCAQEGIRIAEEANNPYSLMFAYAGAGTLWLLRGELSQATPLLERGFELCRVRNFPIPLSLIASSLGIGYALSGRLAEAIPLLEQDLDQATAMKLMVNRSIRAARLGEAYLLSGRVDDALRLAGYALETSREQRQRGYEGYTLRLLGEITAQSDPPDVPTAQAYYRQAMELADELGMRPLVAHCHLGLGKLYGRTGSRSDADTHLTAAIALFHEMGMRFWVEKARRS
ncbi:MAG TPA: adenylate cyclase, partial [Candidatus Methylomirabilis sp.]|nr:adenylate cyclase [Candidatus Methylomirabilis sp.]